MYGWKDLTSLDEVLAKTRQRAQNRQNFTVDRISDLKIDWKATHPKAPNGGYFANINGKEMPLGGQAVRGACKLIKSKPDFFNQFDDKMAFPKALINCLDAPGRRNAQGFKVRTGYADDGLTEQVAAILPGNYEIRDAHEQLAYFAQVVYENLGPIKGIQVMEQGYGDVVAYRAVIGENIMPGTKDEAGQFMMFCLKMSETGAISDETALGLYRLICRNGAMGWDQATLGEWTHRTPVDEYLNKTGSTIRLATHFASAWGKIFQDLQKATLPGPMADMLHAMKSSKMITTEHYDMAEIHAKSGTEPDQTQYDLYNILTRGAQDLPNINQRQSAERKTLKVFTESGGVMEHLEKARKRAELAAQGPRQGLIGAPGHERPQPAFAKQLRGMLGNDGGDN
jgi:hypothetical protein